MEIDVAFDDLIYKDFVKIVKNQIRDFKKGKKYNHIEEHIILSQCLELIKSSRDLLYKNRFIESAGLVRTAFEYIAKTIFIRSSKEKYNNFIEGKYDGEDGVFSTLDSLAEELNTFYPFNISALSNTKAKKIVKGYYNYLSPFIHISNITILLYRIREDFENKYIKIVMMMNIFTILNILLGLLEKYNCNNSIIFDDTKMLSFIILFEKWLIEINSNSKFDKDKFKQIIGADNKDYNEIISESEMSDYNNLLNNYFGNKDNINTICEYIEKYYVRIL